MIDYGLFMMIYKPSVVCILIVYIILYGIIFHEYHFIRISVLTDHHIGVHGRIDLREIDFLRRRVVVVASTLRCSNVTVEAI